MAFSLTKWFDVRSRITRTMKVIAQAQMLLLGQRDGTIHGEESLKQQVTEMNQAIAQHNMNFPPCPERKSS